MSNVLVSIVLSVLMGSACAQEGEARGPASGAEPTLPGTEAVELARRQGVVGCRLEVAYAAPGSETPAAILRDIAIDLGAESSDPEDIAAAFATGLLGADAPSEVIDAAAEGCVKGLRNALNRLQ